MKRIRGEGTGGILTVHAHAVRSRTMQRLRNGERSRGLELLPVIMILSLLWGVAVNTPVWADEIVFESEGAAADGVSSDGDDASLTDDGAVAANDSDQSVSDLSGLFVDTGEDVVVSKGETLEDARLGDEPQNGLGDGGSTINIGHLYVVNGVTVRNSDFPSEHNECWAYANNVYAKIWGHNFWSEFNDTENMLRNLSDAELTLTPEHLKAYVCAAPAGSALRVCNEDYLHGNDIGGHSQIIISHDENGFTVFEGGLSAFPHRREAYYTWTGYCYSGWPGKYHYIKYIKWPGATPYTAGLLGDNAQDLGVSEIDRKQGEICERFCDAMELIGDLILGKGTPEEKAALDDAVERVSQLPAEEKDRL